MDDNQTRQPEERSTRRRPDPVRLSQPIQVEEPEFTDAPEVPSPLAPPVVVEPTPPSPPVIRGARCPACGQMYNASLAGTTGVCKLNCSQTVTFQEV